MKVRMKVNMAKSSGTQEEKDRLTDDIITLKDIVHKMYWLWKDWEVKDEEGGMEK